MLTKDYSGKASIEFGLQTESDASTHSISAQRISQVMTLCKINCDNKKVILSSADFFNLTISKNYIFICIVLKGHN